MKPPLGHGLVFEVYSLSKPEEWRWRLWDARGSIVAVSSFGCGTRDGCLTTIELFKSDVARAQVRQPTG